MSKAGDLSTNEETDYTIKVDVAGLTPATVYYYQFISGEEKSAINETKTTAAEGIAIVILQLFLQQFFPQDILSAFAKIAARKNWMLSYISVTTSMKERRGHLILQLHKLMTSKRPIFTVTGIGGYIIIAAAMRFNRLDPDLQAAHHVHRLLLYGMIMK